MKKIIILTIFLLSTHTAFAARLVPGNLPTTTPLQPMPINTYPNYSGNINTKEDVAPKAEEVSVPGQVKFDDKGGLAEEVSNPNNKISSLGSLVFALILICAVILGYVYYKKNLRRLWK